MMKVESRPPAESAVPVRRSGFVATLTLVFLAVLGVAASRHEFWRDEMQAWLIARDTPDLSALLEQAHYEGAPPLWSFMLRPLTLVTHRPEAVQVLTGVLAVLTMYLFLRFAPFNRLQKVLLVVNSYLLFEYGVVCRNYLPGILALTVAAILFKQAREKPWGFVLALIVATWASVHSLIIAVAMAGAFGLSSLGKTARSSASSRAGGRVFPVWPLAVFAVGAGGAVGSMMPRADTMYSPAHGWILNWNVARLAKVSWAFVNSYFPMPRPPGYFWIPSWDTPFQSYDPGWALALGAIAFVVGIFCFLRHRAALILYLVGTLGVLTFLYVKYLGFSRHTGFLFLTFLFALWIQRADRSGVRDRFARWSAWVTGSVFTVMLVAQAITGVWAIREDFSRPFSCGKPAAQALIDRGLDRAFIAVGPDWAGSPLAGYLDRSVYYPQRRGYGSFTCWDTRREEWLSDGEFFRRAAAEADGREMVIALEHPLDAAFMQAHGIEFLGHIAGSLTPFEDYFLHYVPGRKEGS